MSSRVARRICAFIGASSKELILRRCLGLAQHLGVAAVGLRTRMCDYLDQLVVQPTVGRDDIRAAQVELGGVHITHASACFLDAQCACGHVPSAETELPESVGASCRDVGEIERSRAGPADAL